jgi:hypothetical protein
MEIIVYIGRGVHLINIYNGAGRFIGSKYTSPNGVLRYTVSDVGLYNLICADDNSLSICKEIALDNPYSGGIAGVIYQA